VAQVVGGIVQAGASDPATDQPEAALAWAGPADANTSAGDKDTQADTHGGLSSLELGYRPYLARSCSALARQAAASSGNRVEAAFAHKPS
jgi:hypothetical protein